MTLLESIGGPQDVKRLNQEQLTRLAGEIREFLIQAVSRSGGHLGPNLGVVELTIALHRVFDSPRDRIVLDTGHQSYVHKLLTGRRAGFAKLRQRGGVSGYPSQSESEHDLVENRTPRPRCPMRTGSPRRSSCAANPRGRSWRSSVTVR